jgi:hypothetical protein
MAGLPAFSARRALNCRLDLSKAGQTKPSDNGHVTSTVALQTDSNVALRPIEAVAARIQNYYRLKVTNTGLSMAKGCHVTLTAVWFVERQVWKPSGDRAKPAISRHFKTGHFRLAAETSEFYFVPSSGRKSVCIFVRQLRGPHFSTCA